MTHTHFKPQSKIRASPSVLAAALCVAGLAAPVLAQTASQDALMQKLEQMQQELSRLKGELAEIKAAQTKTQSTAEEANAVAQQAKTQVAEVAAVAGTGIKTGGPSTVVTGYGEINYNRPTKNANATQADLRRAVIGLQHRFNDKTKFSASLNGSTPSPPPPTGARPPWSRPTSSTSSTTNWRCARACSSSPWA